MAETFDPDKYLAETPDVAEPTAVADQFDPDQYLSETSAKEMPQERTSAKVIEDQLRTKTAAVTGAASVESLRRGISGAAQYGLEKIGKLTPEQMQTISRDTEAYSKARPFSELLEQYKELGQQTREAGFTARARGVESLSDVEPFKASELIPSLGRLEKAPKLELTPEELPKARADVSKMNKLESLLKQKQELEANLGAIRESGIESFEIDKQVNDAMKKLEKVKAQISKSLPDTIKEAVVPSIKPTTAEFAKATNMP